MRHKREFGELDPMDGVQNIDVPKTLDVEAVEQALVELWQQTGGDKELEHEEATLRTRAAYEGLRVSMPST